MDELDDISEEERALAAQLASFSEGDASSDAPLTELEQPLALLKNFDRFELSETARGRGRDEVERWAKSPRGAERKKASGLHRWFYWLPMPAVAAAAVFVFLSRGTSRNDDDIPQAAVLSEARQAEGVDKPSAISENSSLVAGDRTDSEADFKKLSPRYHVGETPAALLRAQATVLAERAPGLEREAARDEFERQMRAYRGQLIASIETGGR